MKSLRLTLSAAVFAALFTAMLSGLALGADESAEFRLTAAVVDRLEAIEAEREGEDDNGDDDYAAAADIDAFAARIEANPRDRELLNRHGMKPREFAVAALAMVHAAAFLAVEEHIEQAQAAELLAGYTPAQRANIELLRRRAATAEE